MDEKFIQLYGKKPREGSIYQGERHVYKQKKHDFSLGYRCGMDFIYEQEAQGEDWMNEMRDNLDLERGG